MSFSEWFMSSTAHFFLCIYIILSQCIFSYACGLPSVGIGKKSLLLRFTKHKIYPSMILKLLPLPSLSLSFYLLPSGSSIIIITDSKYITYNCWDVKKFTALTIINVQVSCSNSTVGQYVIAWCVRLMFLYTNFKKNRRLTFPDSGLSWMYCSVYYSSYEYFL